MPHRNRNKINRRVDSNPKPAEIRDARERVGLTPEQAAKRIYSTQTIWQEWETEGAQRRMHPGLFQLFLIKTGQSRDYRPVEGSAAADDDNGGNR